jgi:hypothetical protein
MEAENLPVVTVADVDPAKWSGDLLVVGAFEDAFEADGAPPPPLAASAQVVVPAPLLSDSPPSALRPLP